MSKFHYSPRSLKNIREVHSDLQKVCFRAIELTEVDFIVTDGDRTIAEQKHFVAIGASKTMNSRHIGGHAIDFVALVNGRVSYKEEHMRKVADAFKVAAKELEVPIEWGGDWKGFVDTPHIQLNAKKYPNK
jgi:peptidoglycan LD-endopeptidase CwlK